jgi:hypothetical protein
MIMIWKKNEIKKTKSSIISNLLKETPHNTLPAQEKEMWVPKKLQLASLLPLAMQPKRSWLATNTILKSAPSPGVVRYWSPSSILPLGRRPFFSP